MNIVELPHNKKATVVTKMFLSRCTNEVMFFGGKPTRSYFQVMNFCKKLTDNELNTLYDYLDTLNDKKILSLTDVFYNANKYKSQQKLKDDRKDFQEVEQYENLTVDELMQW